MYHRGIFVKEGIVTNITAWDGEYKKVQTRYQFLYIIPDRTTHLTPAFLLEHTEFNKSLTLVVQYIVFQQTKILLNGMFYNLHLYIGNV